jgi:hypothetical protein
VKHSEAVESKCRGELVRKRVLTFDRELYKEYHCAKCKKWIYTPVDETTPFRFETQFRI